MNRSAKNVLFSKHLKMLKKLFICILIFFCTYLYFIVLYAVDANRFIFLSWHCLFTVFVVVAAVVVFVVSCVCCFHIHIYYNFMVYHNGNAYSVTYSSCLRNVILLSFILLLLLWIVVRWSTLCDVHKE